MRKPRDIKIAQFRYRGIFEHGNLGYGSREIWKYRDRGISKIPKYRDVGTRNAEISHRVARNRETSRYRNPKPTSPYSRNIETQIPRNIEEAKHRSMKSRNRGFQKYRNGETQKHQAPKHRNLETTKRRNLGISKFRGPYISRSLYTVNHHGPVIIS